MLSPGSVSKACTPVVHIKIAGKWMFIPLKIVLIGIDPYPPAFVQVTLSKSRFKSPSIPGRLFFSMSRQMFVEVRQGRNGCWSSLALLRSSSKNTSHSWPSQRTQCLLPPGKEWNCCIVRRCEERGAKWESG